MATQICVKMDSLNCSYPACAACNVHPGSMSGKVRRHALFLEMQRQLELEQLSGDLSMFTALRRGLALMSLCMRQTV